MICPSYVLKIKKLNVTNVVSKSTILYWIIILIKYTFGVILNEFNG